MKYLKKYQVFEGVFIKGYDKYFKKYTPLLKKYNKSLNKINSKLKDLTVEFRETFIPLKNNDSIKYKHSKYKKLRDAKIIINKDLIRLNSINFYIIDSNNNKPLYKSDFEYIQFEHNDETFRLYTDNRKCKIDDNIEVNDNYKSNTIIEYNKLDNNKTSIETNIKQVHKDLKISILPISKNYPILVKVDGNPNWIEALYYDINIKFNKSFNDYKIEFYATNKTRPYKSDDVNNFILKIKSIKYTLDEIQYTLDINGKRNWKKL